MKKQILCLASILLCCSGCVKTIVQADNITLTTTRFLWPGSIGNASLTTSNKTTLKLSGYSSDVNQLVESVAFGVAQGMTRNPQH